MQKKVLEFWSPAPLPEGDAAKDAATPANLKEPEAADLEASSDSSVWGESDIEVVGATVPPNLSELGQRRRRQEYVRSRPPRPA